LGGVALTRRSRFFFPDDVSPAHDAEWWNPTALYLTPLLALLATTLATGLIAGEFDYAYPLRVLVVAVVLWISRHALSLRVGRPAAAIGIGLAGFVLWLLLEPQPDAARVTAWQAHLDTLPSSVRTGWLLSRVVGAVLTVPI